MNIIQTCTVNTALICVIEVASGTEFDFDYVDAGAGVRFVNSSKQV